MNEVNQKRRQAYEEIARRNRTSMNAVEALAGEKAVRNAKPGNVVEGSGGWVKKIARSPVTVIFPRECGVGIAADFPEPLFVFF